MSNVIIQQYGYEWPEDTLQVDIELSVLRDQLYGEEGPLPHFLAIERLLWPEDDVHRWSSLAFQTLVNETITVLMGPADAGKTYPAAKWALIEYWTDPQNTLVLVSSTDVRGLELRVWGAIKDLFNRATDLYPHLDGTPLESYHSITTDKLGNSDDKARVLRKGIICIPCMQSNRYVGLGKYVGVKQKRLRQVADECQLMGSSFLDAIPNFLGKDYKGVFLGNPLDPNDPLGRVAEPLEGWDKQDEPNETATWRTRFHNGICVNFVGTDSPNYDYPNYLPARYPYMIGWRKVEAVKSFWQEDSIQYYSQCKGVMRFGLVGHRVITQQLCRQHNAHDEAVWGNRDVTRVYAIDPAYGGEDRCVGGMIEFGQDRAGKQILRVSNPRVIPIKPGIAKKPEDQIAEAVKHDLESFNIPVENCFYDSFGKGTVGHAFALVFGNQTPKPVDSGGRPSSRPVRSDLLIWDETKRQKRHKRCDEHYSKFVSELWFSVRYTIECGQMRELPHDVMMEGCLREYGIAMGNKTEVEKKTDTRKRMGKSPDLFDWLAVAVEGARTLGFVIGDTGEDLVENDPFDPYVKDGEEYDQILKKAMLVHI
jgi:hypothetical protein